MNYLTLLWHYQCAKKQRFTSRETLKIAQTRKFKQLQHKICGRSHYFAPYANQPLKEWPIMDKALMLQHFDQMNTIGLTLNKAYEIAFQAEHQRDFSATFQGHTVGLSSGTSGQRGIFLVSPQEQAKWVGTILGKMLPRGLFHGERIAFFLRADSNLYQAANNRWITFKFFDLFEDFEQLLTKLTAFQPTIVIAPAQVLVEIAKRAKDIQPVRVISVAEVLDPIARHSIEARFGPIHEVYQATEGFLACSCGHGQLHLNEADLIIEEEPIDDVRFIPIITDLNRLAQPIIRYRLDDILVKKAGLCACGNPAQMIERIEGRLNDTLRLPGNHHATITIFSDLCLRALAQVLPVNCDFHLIQTAPDALTLQLEGSQSLLVKAKAHLETVFQHQGVATHQLHWHLINTALPRNMMQKKTKIQRVKGV